MSDKLKDRAARCVTHHAACDCREYAYRERIDRLEGALRDMLSGWKYIRSFHGDLYGVGWDRAQQKAEEALADDESGEQPCVEKSHALERASRIATDTPTDDGAGGDMLSETIQRAKNNTLNRDGLEALGRIRHRWAAACDDHGPSLIEMRADCETIRRALTAPPTVPESIRGLPEKWRSRVCRGAWDIETGEEARDDCANELDQALAQHSEPGRGETCPVCEKGTLTRVECCICDNCDATPVLTDQICRNDKRLAARSGRVPEGWKLTRHDEWISIGSPDGRVVQIWKGPDMISDVIYRMLEAMLAAAPAPDADEREDG